MELGRGLVLECEVPWARRYLAAGHTSGGRVAEHARRGGSGTRSRGIKEGRSPPNRQAAADALVSPKKKRPSSVLAMRLWYTWDNPKSNAGTLPQDPTSPRPPTGALRFTPPRLVSPRQRKRRAERGAPGVGNETNGARTGYGKKHSRGEAGAEYTAEVRFGGARLQTQKPKSEGIPKPELNLAGRRRRGYLTE